MSSSKKPDKQASRQTNRARRHFLGLAAATGTRVAAIGALAVTTILPPSVARAMGRKWWKKNGGGNEGGAMCFLRGTAIRTPAGETRIEDLEIGDLVETLRGQAMPVKWIGRRLYKRSGPSWNDRVAPVRIARHAIDAATPHRDLYLSPGHALFIDDVLIRAEDLVNGTTIARALPADAETLEYFHIVLESHEAILAEGMPAESFLLKDDNHEGFVNFAEFARLYPDSAHRAMTPLAPVAGYGGRAHLKALLRLAAGRSGPGRDRVHEVHDRIAARAEQMAG